MNRWVVTGVYLVGCGKSDPKPTPVAPPMATVPVVDANTESPAKHMLSAWFAAFNADDFVALHALHMPKIPEDSENFRKRTGGFETRRIEEPSSTIAIAILKEKNSDQFARAEVEVSPEGHRVTRFDMHATETPDEFLTADQRT